MNKSNSILICVVGGTPAVVTETIYALMIERKIPLRQLRLITTTRGELAIRQQLMKLTGQETGGWHLLQRDYPETTKIKFDPGADIIIPTDSAGNQLDDLRTTEDNDCMAETLLNEVRNWCKLDDTAVHASVAGGRKTMSLYLGAAMQIFARPQDKLYHVLVPPEYEGLRGFFYPTPRKVLLPNAQGISIEAQKTRLDLAEIPFVRFRALLTENDIAEHSFSQIVDIAQKRLSVAALPVTISLSLGDCAISFQERSTGEVIDDNHIKVKSLTGFAMYYYLARSLKSGKQWVNIFDPDDGAAILMEIANLLKDQGERYLDTADRFKKYSEEVANCETNNLSAMRNNWNKWLEHKAADQGIPTPAHFSIQSKKENGRSWYGLALDPSSITLDELTPTERKI